MRRVLSGLFLALYSLLAIAENASSNDVLQATVSDETSAVQNVNAEPDYTHLLTNIDEGDTVAEFKELWAAYLKSDAFIQAHTTDEIPYLQHLGAENSVESCERDLPEIQQSIKSHYPNLLLHYSALRCYTLIGDSESAARHEKIFTRLSEVMTLQGDGSDYHRPLWAGAVTDAKSFLLVSGYTVVDSVFVYRSDTKSLYYYVQTFDEDNAEQGFYFAANDLVESLVSAHIKKAADGNALVEKALEHLHGSTLAMRWLAEQGDSAAAIFVGDGYSNYKSETARKLAFDYYQSAAEDGNAIAANRFANLVLKYGQSDLYERAADYLSAAVGKKDCSSNKTLIQMYEKSLGVQRDQEIIDGLIALCASKSDRASYLNTVGWGFYSAVGKHYDLGLAADYWEKAVALEHPAARRALAMALIKGEGRNKDIKAGLRILHDAAMTGDAPALTSMGYYLDEFPEFQEVYGSPVSFSLKAAEQGNEIAMYNLGYFYRLGIGTELNLAESHRWYLKSAEKEYSQSYYHLGLQFLNGLENTMPPDYEKALHYLKLAAEVRDNANAMLALGYMYERGYGTVVDLKQARAWYSQSAVKGNKLAEANLHTSTHRRSGPYLDSPGYIERLEALAEQDDPEAMTSLGFLALYGWGVERDKSVARRWLKKAKNKDYPPAFYLLSDGNANLRQVVKNWRVSKSEQENLRYAADHGIAAAAYTLATYYHSKADAKDDEDDWVGAYRLYLQAAQLDHTRAKFIVADFIERGIGVKKDLATAIRWYEAAAQDDYAPALNALGTIYITDRVPDKSSADAIEYFRRAAEHGLPLALRNLGRIYARGKYTDRDLGKAVEYYLQAADADDPDSFIEVGELFATEPELGPSARVALVYFYAALEKRTKTASFWIARVIDLLSLPKEAQKDDAELYSIYLASANLGNAWAKNNMGVLHLQGRAPDADPDDAVAWFKQSHEEGNHSATANLAWCYEQGLGVRKNIDKAMGLYREAGNAGSPFALARLVDLTQAEGSALYDIEAAQSYRELLDQALHNRVLSTAATTAIPLPEWMQQQITPIYDVGQSKVASPAVAIPPAQETQETAEPE